MKLAVFDIDGTLTGTDDVDGECFVRALEEAHSMTEVNTNWAEYPHTTDSGITQDIFRRKFGRDPDAGEVSSFQARFVALLKERCADNAALFAEIPGAAEALLRLGQDSAWGLALATGGWRAPATLKLEAAGIEHAHLPSAFAEDGISREEIVLAALSRASAHYQCEKFERVVSIGDGVWDVRAAHNLGLPFLGVGGGERAAMLRRAGATHVIADFTNFDLFLQALNDARIPASPVSNIETDMSGSDELRDSYDRVAAEYVRHIYDELKDKPLNRQLLDKFAGRVRDVGTACDMGCGPGQVAAYLRGRGVEVCGVDISPGMLEQARRLNPGIVFEQGDMLALEAADGAWSGIAAFYSIIHVPRGKTVSALRELKRVLRPGGLLLLAFHIGDTTLHPDELWGQPVSLDFHFFLTEEIEGALKSVGFEVEEVIEREPYENVEHPSRRAYIFARKPDAPPPA